MEDIPQGEGLMALCLILIGFAIGFIIGMITCKTIAMNIIKKKHEQ